MTDPDFVEETGNFIGSTFGAGAYGAGVYGGEQILNLHDDSSTNWTEVNE